MKYLSKHIHVAWYLILLITFLIMLIGIGCEGPDGQPGDGVNSVDLVPPEINLLRPLPNDTITSAWFTIEVEASDNDSISFVEFFLDGSSDRGPDSDSAISKNPPYMFTWSIPSNTIAGLHLLTAWATDMSENVSRTPIIPIWFDPRFGEVELSYDEFTDSPVALSLPDEYGTKYMNVRFSPQDSCSLVALYFEFGDQRINGLKSKVDIDILIWNESDNFLPFGLRDSLRVHADSIAFNGWTVIDSSYIQQLISFSGDFHAGWSPAFELYDTALADTNGVVIFATSKETEPLKEPEKHRSSEYDTAQGWGTVQQHWGIKYDLHIRAVVDYGDGVPVMLKPEISSFVQLN